MIGLPPVALAACLALRAASDQVRAGDLAAAVPAFAGLPADTALGWAPAPGIARVFSPAELRRLAARFGTAPAPQEGLCVERPVGPLDPARVQTALQAQVPGGAITVLDYSRQPVPEGVLEFPLSGFGRGAGATYWNGFVRYGGGRRFAVWAKVQVRVSAPVVVAAEELKPGRPIEAAQVRLETRDDFPQTGFVTALEEAVGKLPWRSILAGARVPAQILHAAPDVAPGDTVTVEVWSGAAYLRFEARAEGAARVGQRVALRNPVSGKRFFARVEAKGRVSVGKEES
ncbi:MAG: flagellar basal body P-ring formation chaperone FlgA [Acidobacteriia bacterium]|nr:flagellar basal body P-ring formation chaperone FlgA [Terriglobia bacterium]